MADVYVLGVTGGIGSGKSTVAKILCGWGARVFDADRIVRELYQGGSFVAALRERFGADVVSAEGAVDREALAKVVFARPEARKDLEALIHPAVRQTVQDGVTELREGEFSGLAVVDAALLAEARPKYPLDALLVVTASEDVRLTRLAARGVSAEEARRRMNAQWSDEQRNAVADVIISNNGSMEDLEGELVRALEWLDVGAIIGSPPPAEGLDCGNPCPDLPGDQ